MIQKIKGTQDFLDLSQFNIFIETTKKHLICYNFSQIQIPILEPIELFKRSLGLETDVISKEMYTVKTSYEEDNICLRPEMTASTVRAFLNANIETTPWKVFSYGPVFRHERPQKGRFREFNQFNIEVIGTDSITQDIQLVKMLDRLFNNVLKIKTSTLGLNFLGCLEDRQKFKNKLYSFLEKNVDKLCKNCLERKEKNIMRIFDCKVESCQEIYKNAPFIAENLCQNCDTEWNYLKDKLSELAVSFSYMPKLVRGLDYYSKTVFEFSSTALGAQSAFCGGGRYELAKQLDHKTEVPSIGAAIGIERLLLILEAENINFKIEEKNLHVIIPLSEQQKPLSLVITDQLQAANLTTDILLENDSVKSMMRKANKMDAKYVLLIGDQEQSSGQITVKNMVTGQEDKVQQSNLTNFLQNKNY